jgi:hypothetical protein
MLFRPTGEFSMKRALLALLLLGLLPGLAFAQTGSNNDKGVTTKSTFGGLRDFVTSGGGHFWGDELTMSPRFYRSGTPGDPCVPAFSGSYQYREFSLASDSAGSLTVDFDAGTCSTNAQASLHRVPFNGSSICTNHVWDAGVSGNFSATASVPASTPLLLIVSGVSTAPSLVCGPFSFRIDGTAYAVPTMPEWAMILLALLLVAGGVWVMRRRQLAAQA